jgi:hypothetical protein
MNARLLASRSNGGRGGRPSKSLVINGEKPSDNPSETQAEPKNNSPETRFTGPEGGGSTEGEAKPKDNPRLTQAEPKANPSVTRPSGPSGPSGPSLQNRYAEATVRISLLNQLTGSKFNPPLGELDLIVTRLEETGGDCIGVDRMLRRQVALWQDDAKSRAWLKPGTLFGANFHDYYGQRELPVVKNASVGFNKHRAPASDRTELLETLAATRAALEQNPADTGLQHRVRDLETQTA